MFWVSSFYPLPLFPFPSLHFPTLPYLFQMRSFRLLFYLFSFLSPAFFWHGVSSSFVSIYLFLFHLSVFFFKSYSDSFPLFIIFIFTFSSLRGSKGHSVSLYRFVGPGNCKILQTESSSHHVAYLMNNSHLSSVNN